MNTHKDAATDTGPSGTGKRMDGDKSPRIECVCGDHYFSTSVKDIRTAPGKALQTYQTIHVCAKCLRVYIEDEWAAMTSNVIYKYLEECA